MSVFFISALLVIALSSVAVSGEGCLAAKQTAEDHCGGLGCTQVFCSGDDYVATQCQGNWCWCVAENGDKIGDYGFDHANYGDCQCARDKRTNNALDCGANGSY